MQFGSLWRPVRRALGRAVLAALLAAPTLGAVSGAAGPQAAQASDLRAADRFRTAFVGRNGTAFTLAGAPFRFVGANMYNAAGDPRIHECGPYMSDPERELDDWFRRAKSEFGASVIRFWAFQSYTKGGTDWSAMDRVMRLAGKHGLKVIPVLENQWEACSEGGYKSDAWYGGGYLHPYGTYPVSYREYVERIVSRYKDEPAIMAWMLMNEAESRSAAGQPNPEALYAFARDVSALVKRVDPNHLVTLGVMGGGQPGVSHENFARLHGLATIDFTEFHDYHEEDSALPGAGTESGTGLRTKVFSQDAQWTWRDSGERENRARVWETWSGVVPAGAMPFRQIGINIEGTFLGDIYVDSVRIGDRVYDFEDGTTQGWRSTDPVGLEVSNSDAVAHTGARALRVRRSAGEGKQLWVAAQPGDAPGTPIELRVYVDEANPKGADNSLARALYTSSELRKPLLMGEAGMWACAPGGGFRGVTVEARARRFDEKIGAFFAAGGAGYLVWAWDPTSSCSTDFSSGDPLNDVLWRHSATLAAAAEASELPG